MSTLKTHNLQSPDSGSANIALAPNAGMVVTGISTFSNNIIANTKIGIGTENPSTILHLLDDSNDCDITVQATASGKDARINLYAHSGGYSQIRLGDESDANVGLITYDHSDNSLQLRAGDAERLRIASTGNVSINTTNVTEGVLQVNGDVTAGYHHGGGMYGLLAKRKFQGGNALGGYAMRYASGYESPWIVGYNSGTSFNNQITFGSMTTADRSLETGVQKRMVIDMALGYVGIGTAVPDSMLHIAHSLPAIRLTDSANDQYAFIDGNSGNLILHSDKGASGGSSTLKLAVDNNVKVTVDSSGDLEIHDGDLKVASGHGIDFSATANGTGTNHNELLDDYEEGDWQPKVSAGGANWNTTARYTKVGRIVTIQADITNTSGGGTTEIHNLPFAVDSKYGTWHVGYAAVNGTTTSGNTSYTGGLVHFQGNGFLRARASGGTTNITMGNNHRTIFTGTYYTT